MKSIVQERYGCGAELAVADVEPPTVGAGQVLVRVRAAGVDQGVWHLTTGLPYLVRLGTGLRRPRNPVPGRDLAGQVLAVGASVTGFAVGDEVYGTTSGSYAEQVLASPDRLARKPSTLDLAQAAAIPVSGQTALKAVQGVAAGQLVLVIGAGGGVGTFAVQLAVARGAQVTGLCSASKHDLVRSLGAHDVIDYAHEDVDARGRRYDVIIDTAGNRPVATLRRALLPGGTVALVGGEAHQGRWLQGFGRQLGAPLLSPLVEHRLVAVMAGERSQHLEELTRLVEAGQLTPALDRTFTLAQVPEAIAYLRAGRARGKVVITL